MQWQARQHEWPRPLERLAEVARREGQQAGKEKGRIQGHLEDLFAVLDVRGLQPTESQRAEMECCREVETLERWLRRAAVARHVDEVFDD